MFPKKRLRRLRKPILRDIIKETNLSINDLIYPIFIDENITKKCEIKTMPGVYRYPISEITNQALELIDLGIKAILLFGIPNNKDNIGTSSYSLDGVIQKSILTLKSNKKINDNLIIIADLCLCEYTSHGHCGILSNDKMIIDNDKTLEIIKKIALSYAKVGVDIIAPSGMIDGSVITIRNCLDENGYQDISIMSYSAKYNSHLYGPFRDAADSSFSFGNRSTYQIDYHNSKDAINEIKLDIEEGADIIIVKPGIFYLDILKEATTKYNIPIVGYQVSGEYSMIKAASSNNYLNEMEIFYESLIAFKRAGASMIITYYAKDIANYLSKLNKKGF